MKHIYFYYATTVVESGARTEMNGILHWNKKVIFGEDMEEVRNHLSSEIVDGKKIILKCLACHGTDEE